MPDFLQLTGKTFLVFGVANRKSVAWFVAKTLEEQGARVIYSVRSEVRKKSLATLLADKPVFLCDVEKTGDVDRLAGEIAGRERAEAIQLTIEYDPHPPFDAGHMSKASKEVRQLAHEIMDERMPADQRRLVPKIALRRFLDLLRTGA